jgi:transposase
MKPKHRVQLSAEEREELQFVVRKGKAAAYKRLNAQMLLKADEAEGRPAWKDKDIAETFEVSVRTVERLRERLCNRGFENCLERAKGAGRKRKLDGKQEAKLIVLTCSEPPEGRARWTLRLLADRMVELEYVDEISHEAVRRVLKKRNQTLAKEGMVHSSQIQR